MTVVDMNGQAVTRSPQDDLLPFTRQIVDQINGAFQSDASDIEKLFAAIKELEKRILWLEKLVIDPKKRNKPWWRK